MVSHLHPRSRSTLSLFTGCLAVSFLVVGMPHIFPCPVDRRQFADSGPDSSKRRRRRVPKENEDGSNTAEDMIDDSEARAKARACPVPKPNGLLGQIMGFKEDKDRDGAVVVVKSLQEARYRKKADNDVS
ncbi:hypothetical protein MBLNU457_1330t1 [Dothideomycetes sp. NU457]